MRHFWTWTFFLAILATALAGCELNTLTDGAEEDGDDSVEDGDDPEDGDTVDGDDPAEDGDTVDGDTVDGDDPAEDGDTVDGDDPVEDGDDPDGDTDGDVDGDILILIYAPPHPGASADQGAELHFLLDGFNEADVRRHEDAGADWFVEVRTEERPALVGIRYPEGALPHPDAQVWVEGPGNFTVTSWQDATTLTSCAGSVLKEDAIAFRVKNGEIVVFTDYDQSCPR